MNKWETINAAFKKEMLIYQPKQAGENWDLTKNYAGILAGSPLQKSRICVLGINWGADPGVYDKWHDKPPSEGQLANFNESGKKFGKPIVKMFARALKKEIKDVQEICKAIFYTNRCLVMSSNPSLKLVNDSIIPSSNALRRMLSIVKPSLIVCFGNGGIPCCPSTFVLQQLCKINPWWSGGTKEWAIGNTKVRRFPNKGLFLLEEGANDPLIETSFIDVLDIWSFPHPNFHQLFGNFLEEFGKSLKSFL